MFWRALLFISVPIFILMILHGAAGMGVAVPQYMLEPIFASCLIATGIILLIWMIVRVIPLFIIILGLLLLWIVGYGYVYANYIAGFI